MHVCDTADDIRTLGIKLASIYYNLLGQRATEGIAHLGLFTTQVVCNAHPDGGTGGNLQRSLRHGESRQDDQQKRRQHDARYQHIFSIHFLITSVKFSAVQAKQRLFFSPSHLCSYRCSYPWDALACCTAACRHERLARAAAFLTLLREVRSRLHHTAPIKMK